MSTDPVSSDYPPQTPSAVRASLDAIFPKVYGELKTLAARHMARERADHTLQPTALVHEVYQRLIDQSAFDPSNRAYFFCVAATMMRRVLVNHARDRAAQKRGAGAVRVTLSEIDVLAEPAVDLVALHDAIESLARLNARQAQVVELKFFGGLDEAEIASTLGVSPATVRRDWALAKMFLGRELNS